MGPVILVVTNPPHGDVDVAAAAALLGLNERDTRPKVAFPAPEVLRAAEWTRARETAEALGDAGLSVTVADGNELERVPWPTVVRSFAFGDTGLVARLPMEEIGIPYDTSVTGVYCTPPADFEPPAGSVLPPPGTGLRVSEAIEWLGRLDLFFVRGGSLRRLSIVAGATDFAGLGTLRGDTKLESLANTLVECRRRFSDLVVDARMESVRPRHRFVAGEEQFDKDLRKGYSFGTLLLRQALESVSPELRDVTHYELASRIAYVLSKHGREKWGTWE